MCIGKPIYLHRQTIHVARCSNTQATGHCQSARLHKYNKHQVVVSIQCSLTTKVTASRVGPTQRHLYSDATDPHSVDGLDLSVTSSQTSPQPLTHQNRTTLLPEADLDVHWSGHWACSVLHLAGPALQAVVYSAGHSAVINARTKTHTHWQQLAALTAPPGATGS